MSIEVQDKETQFMKRGIVFAIIILLGAGYVAYDDICHEGVSTSFKYKMKKLFKTEKKKVEKDDSKIKVEESK